MASVGAILGLFLIVVGFACLFDRNTVWQWTEVGNRTSNYTSERTPEWDAVTQTCGVGCVLLGIMHLALQLASR